MRWCDGEMLAEYTQSRNPGQSRPPAARRHGCLFQMPVFLRPFPLKDYSTTVPQDQHNLI
jgi:hypothetical protein